MMDSRCFDSRLTELGINRALTRVTSKDVSGISRRMFPEQHQRVLVPLTVWTGPRQIIFRVGRTDIANWRPAPEFGMRLSIS